MEKMDLNANDSSEPFTPIKSEIDQSSGQNSGISQNRMSTSRNTNISITSQDQLIPSSSATPLTVHRTLSCASGESPSYLPVPFLSKIPTSRRDTILKALRKCIPRAAAQRRAVIKKNAEYARLCILDAFQGRLSNGLANNSKKSYWIYTIFCIQTSDLMFQAVVLASCLHTFSIFFEPANQCPASILFKLYQWLVVIIYAIDIALKMGYEGIKEYFSHDWQQLYAMNLALHILDLLVCSCTCYANPLRPVAGLLRARKGRKFFDALKKMVPGMMHSLVPIIFFVVIIMVLSSIIFSAKVVEFTSTAYTSYNWLFLILTNDNFDRLLPESMFMNMAYLLFFFPAIYVGQRFLVSLIIGDTYDTFRSFVKKQLKKEKLKEMQGLTKAFAALDDMKTGVISDVVFRECMLTLHPGMPEENIAVYFELLAGGNQAGITVLQFLSLRKVLNFKLNHNKPGTSWLATTAHNLYVNVSSNYHNMQLPISEKAASVASKLMQFIEDYQILDRLNLFDIIVLSSDMHDYPVYNYYLRLLGVDLLSLAAEQTFFESVLRNVTVGHIVHIFYLCEFFIRLLHSKGKISEMTEGSNLISKLFQFGCIAALLYEPFLHFSSCTPETNIAFTLPYLSYACAFKLREVHLAVLLCRCLRMANLNEDLQDFNSALMDVLPALFETFSFTFIVTYIFGGIGNILFGSLMSEWSTPTLAIVKAQQLTFMVSFLDSMERAMEEVHPAAALYFLFYLILSLTVSNIALSIIIDLHGTVLESNTSKHRAKQKKMLDSIFEKVLSQARLRGVFSPSRAKQHMNFKNITVSEFQSTDVRHFITDAKEHEVKVEDLKQCQKYANIDLVRFYNETISNFKDLTWEVDFLKAIHEANIHVEKVFSTGETIFEMDSPATHLYILTNGNVTISRPSRGIMEYALFHPTNILGGEAMQPNTRYSYSCTAEHETRCLILKQEDVVSKLSAELCGTVIRMVFKSAALLETAWTEAKRRNRRFSSMSMDFRHTDSMGTTDLIKQFQESLASSSGVINNNANTNTNTPR